MNEFMYYNPVKLFCGEHQLSNVIKEIQQYGHRVLLFSAARALLKMATISLGRCFGSGPYRA